MNEIKKTVLNQSPSHSTSVQFDRVGLRYGRGAEILSDVSFALEQGSMNFVTGQSGAGKTSLLKLIYLNMRPSRGLISLFGRDTSQLGKLAIPSVKRRMGIVLQDFRLIDHLSVYENIALPLRVVGKAREEYHEDIVSLLDWVGMGKRSSAFPPTLSAGEKQRAAIARALIIKPEVLVADEPTGNVDKEIGARLIHLFAEMNRLGTTVIIATHDKGLIPSSADLLYLQSGTVIHKRGEHD